jgi:hypothetical protein
MINTSLYWFLNFEEEPMMSCRLCYFPHDEGEHIREKLHFLEFAAKELGGSGRGYSGCGPFGPARSALG